MNKQVIFNLAVKDLEASRQFYERSGVRTFGGNAAQNRLNFGTSLLSLGASLGGSYLGGRR